MKTGRTLSYTFLFSLSLLSIFLPFFMLLFNINLNLSNNLLAIKNYYHAFMKSLNILLSILKTSIFLFCFSIVK